MAAKTSDSSRASRLARDFRTRVAQLLFLLSALGGLVLLGAGVIASDLRNIVAGLLLLSLGYVTRRHLRERARFASTAIALENFVTDLSATAPDKAAHLAELLRTWEKLESQRGSPGFDPWALLSVHHDIQRILREDPVLRRLFHA